MRETFWRLRLSSLLSMFADRDLFPLSMRRKGVGEIEVGSLALLDNRQYGNSIGVVMKMGDECRY